MEILLLLIVALVVAFASTNRAPSPKQTQYPAPVINTSSVQDSTEGGSSVGLLLLMMALAVFLLLVIAGGQI
jgi:hypothetical protein